MAQGHPIQESFNAGLFGPLLGGRVTHARYPYACSTLENFIPTLQGPAVKRPGTRFVCAAKYDNKTARLQRFEYSQEQAYVLEFGDLYARVFRNSSAVLNPAQSFATPAPTAASTVVCTITAHGYTSDQSVFITGSGMVELNDRFFRINVTGVDTFELVGENGSGRTTSLAGTAATQFEIVTPYAHGDVTALQFEQSNDVLYIAHKDYPPAKMSRTSDTAWAYTVIVPDEPAFNVENKNLEIAIIPEEVVNDAATGDPISVFAIESGTAYGDPFDPTFVDLFTPDMVGTYLKLREDYAQNYAKWQPAASATDMRDPGVTVGSIIYNDGSVFSVATTAGSTTGYSGPRGDHMTVGTVTDGKWTYNYINDGYGYGKIVEYVDATEVKVDIIRTFPYSSTFASGFGPEQTTHWAFGAWGEKSGYPRSVSFFEDRLFWAGTVEFPQALWGSASGDYENYAYEGSHSGGLFFILNTRRQNGIEWMKGERGLLVGTSGAEFTIDGGDSGNALSKENFRTRASSFYGTRNGVAAIQVDSAILFPQRAGRKVHELLYERDTDSYQAPDLTAFSEEVLDGLVKGMEELHEPWRAVMVWMEDGTWATMTYIREEGVTGWASQKLGGTNTKVVSMAAIPHPDGDEDQAWLLTSRTIDSATRVYVEVLEKRWETSDAIADAFFVDAGLTYAGAAATVITNLYHLEGETVRILADGVTVPAQTVSSGSITLASAASKVQVGLAYDAKLKTMRFETGGKSGTAQGKTKRASKLVLRLHETSSGLFYGGDFTTMDEVELTGVFSGDTSRLIMPTGYAKEGEIAVLHNEPGPCQLLAIIPMFKTEEGL